MIKYIGILDKAVFLDMLWSYIKIRLHRNAHLSATAILYVYRLNQVVIATGSWWDRFLIRALSGILQLIISKEQMSTEIQMIVQNLGA